MSVSAQPYISWVWLCSLEFLKANETGNMLDFTEDDDKTRAIRHTQCLIFCRLVGVIGALEEGPLGPDRLESTILKIVTGKISLVIRSLQFWQVTGCYGTKVNFLLVILANNWLFSNSSLLFPKITSFRWQEENNRLLFSIIGIDDLDLKGSW